MTITIRAQQLPQAEWLKAGAMVSVRLGSEIDAGMLRILPGGSFRLARFGGREKNSDTLVVTVPPLPGMTPTGPRTAVLYECGDDCLEITLPGWAFEAAKTLPVPAPPLARSGLPYRTAATAPGAPRPSTGGR